MASIFPLSLELSVQLKPSCVCFVVAGETDNICNAMKGNKAYALIDDIVHGEKPMTLINQRKSRLQNLL